MPLHDNESFGLKRLHLNHHYSALLKSEYCKARKPFYPIIEQTINKVLPSIVHLIVELLTAQRKSLLLIATQIEGSVMDEG